MTDAVTVALVGGLAAIISTVIAFFGGKGSAQAQLQDYLNKGMKEMLALSKAEKLDCQKELAGLRGEMANLRQYQISLVHALHRAGIEVPKFRPVEVVFLPLEDTIPEEEVDG